MRIAITLTIACLFVFCLAGLPWEQPVRAVTFVEQPNHSFASVSPVSHGRHSQPHRQFNRAWFPVSHFEQDYTLTRSTFDF